MSVTREIEQKLDHEAALLEEELRYTAELKTMITTEQLTESYQSFCHCLTDFRAELFKKEQEYLYFFSNINRQLKMDEFFTMDLKNPSLRYDHKDICFSMLFYYTTQGKCEISFEHCRIDLLTVLTVDMLEKKASIRTGDLLHLAVDIKIKSFVIRYLNAVMQQLEGIGFIIEKESKEVIDPFLTYQTLSFEILPAWTEKEMDRLFIASTTGDLTYNNETFDYRDMTLTLDKENSIQLKTDPKMTKVQMKNEKEEIYLFDLLGQYPELELFFAQRIYNVQK